MAETTDWGLRIDRDWQHEADRGFGPLGLDLAAAVNAFGRQSVRRKNYVWNFPRGQWGGRRLLS